MSAKKYFLVSEVTTFYDGHGNGDFGGETLNISSDKEFHDLDSSKMYNEDFEEVNDDGHSEQDGYNCQITTITFKEITEEESITYQKTLDDYAKLIKLIE